MICIYIRGLNSSSLFLLLLLFYNIVTFIIMGIDKQKARKHRWRVSEKALFTLAFLFGGLGVASAMLILRHKTRHNSFRVLIPVALIINAIVIIYILKIVSGVGVTHFTYNSDKIPQEFDGFKILQISDFHNGTFGESIDSIVKKIKDEKPDIIVNTGDLTDETVVDTAIVNQFISQLVKLAPVYSVSGNHDIWFSGYDKLQKLLVSKGVLLVDNKKETINVGNSYINLFGIADPEVWDDVASEKYLKDKAYQLKPDESAFNILLFHRSNMFESVKGLGYQLVLSGHLHGGQIQIPFVGGIKSPHGSWFPKFSEGKWSSNGTTMVVSRGLGNVVFVPRLLNPPEIVTVTLKRVE